LSAHHYPARTSRLRWAVAITAGAAVSLIALAGSASGSPAATSRGSVDSNRPITVTDPVPAGFTSWDEVNAVQQRLSAISDQIHEAAAAPDGTGFGSIVSEPQARQLKLYWKGSLPASVRTLLAKDTGVSVVVQRAAFSEKELQTEANRMMAANQVTGVAPQADASGLKVFVSGSATAGRELASVRAAAVPVAVESAPLPEAASRANDSNPYFGGANWTGDGGCSTGFAISLGGVTKMLSAGHCATNGITAFDGGGDTMGTVTKSSDSLLDALFINTSAAGVIFNGGPGTGEFTNSVLGRHFNNVGDFVCTSGAYSGTRCNIKIVQTGVTQTFSQGPGKPNVTFNRLALAEQQDKTNASGNGDSGGPVFEVDTDNTKVWAKGTITGSDAFANPATCTGVPASSTRSCSWRVWYTSVAQSLNSFGAQIVVG
jgi:hypothetical protein